MAAAGVEKVGKGTCWTACHMPAQVTGVGGPRPSPRCGAPPERQGGMPHAALPDGRGDQTAGLGRTPARSAISATRCSHSMAMR